jgi:hypothetical protein
MGWFISVLSGGDGLRPGRGLPCAARLCHRVMRHFRCRELAPLPVASLPRRLQTASPRLRPVPRARTPERLSPLLATARDAESAATITATAQPKLDAAPPTTDKPETLRRQPGPCRRFLDTELRPWSKGPTPCGVSWPEFLKAQSSSSGPSLILAGALSTTARRRWPRSLPISGESRPAPSRGFHRPHADPGARSQSGGASWQNRPGMRTRSARRRDGRRRSGRKVLTDHLAPDAGIVQPDRSLVAMAS